MVQNSFGDILCWRHGREFFLECLVAFYIISSKAVQEIWLSKGICCGLSPVQFYVFIYAWQP